MQSRIIAKPENTIAAAFEKVTKYPTTHPSQVRSKYLLFEWVLSAGLPYSIGKISSLNSIIHLKITFTLRVTLCLTCISTSCM